MQGPDIGQGKIYEAEYGAEQKSDPEQVGDLQSESLRNKTAEKDRQSDTAVPRYEEGGIGLSAFAWAGEIDEQL